MADRAGRAMMAPQPQMGMKKGGKAESKAMAKKEISFMKKKGAPKSMIKHEKAEYGMKKVTSVLAVVPSLTRRAIRRAVRSRRWPVAAPLPNVLMAALFAAKHEVRWYERFW